jgi:hypothetical protein
MFDSIYGENGEFTFKVKCKLCGEVLESGLCSLGNHTLTCPEMVVGLVGFINGFIVKIKKVTLLLPLAVHYKQFISNYREEMSLKESLLSILNQFNWGSKMKIDWPIILICILFLGIFSVLIYMMIIDISYVNFVLNSCKP